jgi:hypothetical protein
VIICTSALHPPSFTPIFLCGITSDSVSRLACCTFLHEVNIWTAARLPIYSYAHTPFRPLVYLSFAILTIKSRHIITASPFYNYLSKAGICLTTQSSQWCFVDLTVCNDGLWSWYSQSPPRPATSLPFRCIWAPMSARWPKAVVISWLC